jgi:hypothetical protein
LPRPGQELVRSWKEDTIQLKKNSATYRSHKKYVFEKKQILIDLEDMCPLAFLNVLDFDSLCYGIWETANPEAVA